MHTTRKSQIVPFGTFRPCTLLIESLRTLESAAEPSHPGKMYTNLRFLSHTANVFVEICPFLVLYLGLSELATFTLM